MIVSRCEHGLEPLTRCSKGTYQIKRSKDTTLKSVVSTLQSQHIATVYSTQLIQFLDQSISRSDNISAQWQDIANSMQTASKSYHAYQRSPSQGAHGMTRGVVLLPKKKWKEHFPNCWYTIVTKSKIPQVAEDDIKGTPRPR